MLFVYTARIYSVDHTRACGGKWLSIILYVPRPSLLAQFFLNKLYLPDLSQYTTALPEYMPTSIEALSEMSSYWEHKADHRSFRRHFAHHKSH